MEILANIADMNLQRETIGSTIEKTGRPPSWLVDDIWNLQSGPDTNIGLHCYCWVLRTQETQVVNIASCAVHGSMSC